MIVMVLQVKAWTLCARKKDKSYKSRTPVTQLPLRLENWSPTVAMVAFPGSNFLRHGLNSKYHCT